MPCYQVNTVSLDFQAGDQAILAKAASALGLTIRNTLVLQNGVAIASLEKGTVTCETQYVPLINKLRVQYSKEVVNHACLKLGWQKVVKADNKIQLKKGM